MAPVNVLIETGVDKLVELVRKNSKISISDAAKALNVSTDVIEEWADFLEEEGIINVEYKLTTPYLVVRDMDKVEVEKKAKEFMEKKDSFVRNAEASVSKLRLDSEILGRMKEEFSRLKEDLGDEVKKMKTDLAELERYEAMKEDMANQINEAKQAYAGKIEELNKQAMREKKKYSEIAQELDEEKKAIEKKRDRLDELKSLEKNMEAKVEEFRAMTEKIAQSVRKEETGIQDSEEHIKRLEKVIEKVKEDLGRDFGSVDDIIKDNQKAIQKIEEMQNSIIEKAKKFQEAMASEGGKGKNAAKKFQEFFEKKIKADEMIKEIEMEGQLLERELEYLIKKAKAFELSSNSRKMGAHIKEMKTRFDNVEKKKERYISEVKKLMNIFG